MNPLNYVQGDIGRAVIFDQDPSSFPTEDHYQQAVLHALILQVYLS